MHANSLRRIVIFSILLAFLLGACAPAATPGTPTASPTQTSAPVTLTDGLGRKVTLPAPARRVVSLSPSNTELVYELGAGSQLVGRDDLSDYPADAKSLPSVGGSMGDYNYEAIANLKPDLVLAAGINTPEQVKSITDLGIPVYYVPNPTDFNSLNANILAIAQLLGDESDGVKVTHELSARVKTVETQVAKTKDHPLVYYELDATDPTKPWTAGPGSFVAMIITAAGGTNIGQDLSSQWAQMSQEDIIARDPDYILLGDGAYGITPQSLAQRPGWGSLKAVKENHVIVVDDNLFSRPTGRMVDALELVAKLLHPDLFK
jgi:iron complex transport system substrate-binding protein